MSNLLWVAPDGSYGTGRVKMFDTTNWLEKDWQRLDEACDSDKQVFARYISRKRNKQAKRVQEIVEGAKRIEVRTIIIQDVKNGLDDNA